MRCDEPVPRVPAELTSERGRESPAVRTVQAVLAGCGEVRVEPDAPLKPFAFSVSTRAWVWQRPRPSSTGRDHARPAPGRAQLIRTAPSRLFHASSSACGRFFACAAIHSAICSSVAPVDTNDLNSSYLIPANVSQR